MKLLSIQDVEDIERKQKEMRARELRLALELATTPVYDGPGPMPTASRFGKARDSVPLWSFHDV